MVAGLGRTAFVRYFCPSGKFRFLIFVRATLAANLDRSEHIGISRTLAVHVDVGHPGNGCRTFDTSYATYCPINCNKETRRGR